MRNSDIVYMIMLTRSWERIFNPMHYTGIAVQYMLSLLRIACTGLSTCTATAAAFQNSQTRFILCTRFYGVL